MKKGGSACIEQLSDAMLPLSVHMFSPHDHPNASITLRHGEAIIRTGVGPALRCSQARLIAATIRNDQTQSVFNPDCQVALESLLEGCALTSGLIPADLQLSGFCLKRLNKDLATRFRFGKPIIPEPELCRLPAYPVGERIFWDIDQPKHGKAKAAALGEAYFKLTCHYDEELLLEFRLAGLKSDIVCRLDRQIRAERLLGVIDGSLEDPEAEVSFTHVDARDSICLTLSPGEDPKIRLLKLYRLHSGTCEQCSEAIVSSSHLQQLTVWLRSWLKSE